jgi:flavin reductase (DIM6/NTAB) family NADH-FMN oxidoreductase RutF
MHGVSAEQFRQVLGRFPTGVTVLTARNRAGDPVGMTASAVSSVSLDPPLVLVCVNHEHDMHAALLEGQHFALNVLASDQERLSRRFAEVEHDRFSGVAYRQNAHGIALLEGTAATIECEKHATVPGGDHTVFFGLVTAGSVAERRPLIYYRGGYASL